jgi:hypothetical protein
MTKALLTTGHPFARNVRSVGARFRGSILTHAQGFAYFGARLTDRFGNYYGFACAAGFRRPGLVNLRFHRDMTAARGKKMVARR